MAAVTEFLIQLISRQLDEHGLVVWYDPEQAYRSLIQQWLALPAASCPLPAIAWDGSFFQLRHTINQLLNDGQPPRLVVYVPLEREQTHSALIELDVAGVILQPRQQPPACNTRLSVVARNALKPLLAEDQLLEIERQVEAGKLSLNDLNSLAEKGKDISTGVLSLIFGTANPQEVALAFLHSDQVDPEVLKKDAAKELRHLLQLSFDIELPAADPPGNWRTRLARHVLVTELAAVLTDQLPAAFGSVSHARSTAACDACLRLNRTWRNSREHRDSYVAAATRTEQELALAQLTLPPERITDSEMFLCIEHTLITHVERELLSHATPQLQQLATRRLSSFWADVVPAIQARWALIAAAAEVLLEADRVGKELRKAPASIPALVTAYAEGDQPWCQLDTHHRHLESRRYHFEFAATEDHSGLEKLLTKAEQRYTEVGGALSQHFVMQFAKAKHPLPGLLRQRDIFETQVRPRLNSGKLAYVWVDALRYEMARELCRLLLDDFSMEIRPAVGTMPTITEIGMAALLPKAHESARVVSAGGGRLALEIDGRVIRDRRDRVAFLKEHAGTAVFDTRLEDLLPKPSKRVRDGIQAAQLLLVTSQEIDELGEADNLAQARLQIDGVLNHLRRGLRVLADHGVTTIVLAADHGHLFGDEIGEDMKIDAPGGRVEDLHRRVWVGIGGNSETSYLRASLASLGVDSEFDLATPWNFAVFRSKGGGRAYFHGGLSPQELIVPLVVMQPVARVQPQPRGIQWTLKPGTAKLTTRFISVQVVGMQSRDVLFGFEPPTVRVEIRANRKCVSSPVSASYGFQDATGEVRLAISETDSRRTEPNTITLMVSEDITQKTASLCLLDAATGAELGDPLSLEVAISF